MSITNRVLKIWHYIFGAIFGVILFYLGLSRISTGIRSIRATDAYTAHFMNVGLIYIYLSLLILIFLTIIITHSLTTHKE